MKINYSVTGARRKELAQAIGAALELRPKYMGMPSAAYRIGSFTLSKDGVLDYFESTDIEDVRKVLDAVTEAGFEPAAPEEPENEKESEGSAETATAADTEPQEGDPEETGGRKRREATSIRKTPKRNSLKNRFLLNCLRWKPLLRMTARHHFL